MVAVVINFEIDTHDVPPHQAIIAIIVLLPSIGVCPSVAIIWRESL
jgi:hypothetical protein